MKYVISIAGSLIALFLLQVAVSTFKPVVFHPFWHDKAHLIGAGIGVIIVVILYVVEKYKATIFKILSYLVFAGMIISLSIAWYYAGIFVNSANFEASAGKNWYVAYHVFLAMFVPVIALIIRRLIPASNANS